MRPVLSNAYLETRHLPIVTETRLLFCTTVMKSSVKCYSIASMPFEVSDTTKDDIDSSGKSRRKRHPPARFSGHPVEDPEDTLEFDDAPGWVRGEEWSWVKMKTPASLTTSEKTRIKLYSGKTTITETISSTSIQSDSTGPLTPSSSTRINPKDKDGSPGRSGGSIASPDSSPSRFKTMVRGIRSPIGKRRSTSPILLSRGHGIEYRVPDVVNADECDFPCLYRPETADEGSAPVPELA